MLNSFPFVRLTAGESAARRRVRSLATRERRTFAPGSRRVTKSGGPSSAGSDGGKARYVWLHRRFRASSPASGYQKSVGESSSGTGMNAAISSSCSSRASARIRAAHCGQRLTCARALRALRRGQTSNARRHSRQVILRTAPGADPAKSRKRGHRYRDASSGYA